MSTYLIALWNNTTLKKIVFSAMSNLHDILKNVDTCKIRGRQVPALNCICFLQLTRLILHSEKANILKHYWILENTKWQTLSSCHRIFRTLFIDKVHSVLWIGSYKRLLFDINIYEKKLRTVIKRASCERFQSEFRKTL